MSEFDTVLTEIFDRSAERRLNLTDERQAIADAQAGDQEAPIELLYAYAPSLRAHASRHAARIGVEEARSAAVAGLLGAVYDFDLDSFPDFGIAGIVSHRISDSLESVPSSAFSIPERTVRRFIQILRAAEGDVSRAAAMAPSYRMSSGVFWAVLGAYRSESINTGLDDPSVLDTDVRRRTRALPLWVEQGSDAFADADSEILAELAFTAVTPPQRDVIDHAYGFVNGDPMSDGEVAQAISVRDLGEDAVSGGQTSISRATAQRLRAKGLAAMREKVGA